MAIDTAVLQVDHDSTYHPDNLSAATTRRNGRPLSEWAGLALLLVGTAVAYLWNLTASGYANSFYAAAVEAGTKSWKAFFFGSLDSSNFITVDKPPASLWLMELSGRIFGFSSASMLVPEVLAGVATVALVYAMVRRWFGARAGLVAGIVMATTPVAALMFRFNNPDALLILLLAGAAYGVTRAVEDGRTRWLLLAGAAVGFGFLTKMGQALLIVPGLGGAYLLAGPVRLRRRMVQLGAAGLALAASAGWWVLIVTLWPASTRPMIDGSSTNSIWNLIVGYNGLQRVVASGGGAGGGGGGAGFSGTTGLGRLFNDLMGGQASWLLPAALIALLAGLVATARQPRTDRTRAALVMWGGWLLVTGLVFSYGQGVIHTYYTVALVPAIAALVGIGWSLVARNWHRAPARWLAAAAVAATGWWASVVLDRTPAWEPWLRPLVLAMAAVGAAGLLASTLLRSGPARRVVATAAVLAACTAGLAGPTAYALQTINTSHTGSIPSAGPAVATNGGGAPGAGTGTGGGGGPAGNGGPGGGVPSGRTGLPGSSTGQTSNADGVASRGQPGTAPTRSGAASGFSGGPTAGDSTAQVSTALVTALKADASRYRWVAATNGSQSAAELELATGGAPVMAIGGFNGQGGQLSLAQFESYVRAGAIHYYIAGGGGSPDGSSNQITAWVESHFTAKTIGGTTVYDLTSPKG